MTDQKTGRKPLGPRSTPIQKRSKARREQILDVAAGLLEKLGSNSLTTIRIAEEVGISVGTLYHYFPNKEAILYAMGQHWLEEMATTLESPDNQPVNVETFVEHFVQQILKLYRQQNGLLHLVQGMFAIPQLMPLDQQHDDLVIDYVANSLPALGIDKAKAERQRIGRSFHEVSHALLLVVVNQSPRRGNSTLAELKLLLRSLLNSHQG
ncbi:TetR/AcrR family transcriptional regulator [Lacimicrobium alkaliphilum]|uniref:TetR family transcriptional regulator n=1 Tax=Lacimicrobium alkaliphilum TaxID=1526571 RepID=A0ABQ1R9N0_9ALTE|nr:TetR/AcrR family transcriptional regulator [Lacimicrobium alkaliphilum]GGD63211.1 TetR family transcriptional regulator [Lacimicrobium alkaliphilum]